ncbi:PP2C family protein-serine/threonine phosphatase [Pseudomonas mangiferae]|uniref:Serine/threonine-protein phosphatase n=1 Tax=Pseudomonas mangiferae TaxID=2593654 RepID=A0A553H4X6_9PSED|nr:PP2C family serine/threonine-protein phosphatase [Pseudomonas mangiferae]TRX76776.1 serine/threonine-protein phosphatase [Pseudomonas mangiferae]
MSVYVAVEGPRVEFATLSKQGRREHNEDACGYWTSPGGACFVVCDGAGGHGGGDVASETAVRTLLSAFSSRPLLTRENIESLIAQADSAIRYGQRLTGSLRQMSATVTALFLDGSARQAQWIHLGDTRLYHFRKRGCRQLTKDHSIVQNFVDAGMLSESRVRGHSERNLLFAALGMGEDVPPAALDVPFDVEEGDAFLICTDGFWEVVLESEMLDELMYASAAEEWLVRMERLIIERSSPGQDNYSALAVWVGSPNDMTVPWVAPSVGAANLSNG